MVTDSGSKTGDSATAKIRSPRGRTARTTTWSFRLRPLNTARIGRCSVTWRRLTRNSKRILGDSDLGGPQLRAELARVWTKFVAALAASADLIASDRELIAADVADDLERRRVARDSPNPF